MDMDFTISAALWGAALATAVSFTTAIGVTAVARGKRPAKSGGRSSANRHAMEESVVRDPPMDSIDNIDIPFYQKDAGENGWESARVDMGADTEADSQGEAPGKAPEEAPKEIPGESQEKTMEDGLVSAIAPGAAESGFDKARSERYKEEGRLHVHQWDMAFSQGEWEWDLLEQAAGCYVKAIRCDPENQNAWLNLAFTYHLSGDKKKATECLEKSNILAGPGSYESSRDYRQVATAVQNDTTLFGQKLHRPPLPGERQTRELTT